MGKRLNMSEEERKEHRRQQKSRSQRNIRQKEKENRLEARAKDDALRHMTHQYVTVSAELEKLKKNGTTENRLDKKRAAAKPPPEDENRLDKKRAAVAKPPPEDDVILPPEDDVIDLVHHDEEAGARRQSSRKKPKVASYAEQSDDDEDLPAKPVVPRWQRELADHNHPGKNENDNGPVDMDNRSIDNGPADNRNDELENLRRENSKLKDALNQKQDECDHLKKVTVANMYEDLRAKDNDLRTKDHDLRTMVNELRNKDQKMDRIRNKIVSVLQDHSLSKTVGLTLVGLLADQENDE